MDFQRMIRSRQFWIAVFVATAGLFLGTAWPEWKKDTVFASGTFLQLAKDSLKSRVVLFLIPVTAVIPWGEEYLKEKQGNFLRSLIIRKGKRFYCMDRSVMTALSGILVWIIASFLQTLFFFLLFFLEGGSIFPLKRTGDRICDFACPGLSCHFRYGKPWRSLRGME